MLIELLSPSNYISFNIKVAELLGLHTAIYLTELMNINDKAIRKNKIDDSYFTLDRKYMTRRTTLKEAEQISIEQNLLKLGILTKGKGESELALDITVLTTLMMSTDEHLLGSVKKLTALKNRQPKPTKAEKIKNDLKASVKANNEELKDAYCEWIDAVYAKQGWMSLKSVTTAQTVVDNFSKRNLDVALRLIEIAAIHGYRDMEWAVNAYNKQHTVNYKVTNEQHNTPVKLSEEVF